MDCPTECSECSGVSDVTPVPREYPGVLPGVSVMTRIKTDICLCYMNMDIPHLFVIANGRFLIRTSNTGLCYNIWVVILFVIFCSSDTVDVVYVLQKHNMTRQHRQQAT